MVTGDHDDSELDEREQAKPEQVKCTCGWQMVDTGTFFSRRVAPDPDCPAHRRP